MKLTYERGTSGIIGHVFIQDSSVTTGAGKTGLVFNTSGLLCSKLRAGETLTVVTLETITTLGTFASPTANTNMRFKEVSSTSWPGLYEVHLHADWTDGVNVRRNCLFTLFGAANMAPVNVELQLTTKDPAVKGICTTGGTQSSIVTSSLGPTPTVADQFKGRIVIFDPETTTAALRCQATDITASTSGGTLTVTTLTTAPVSGDTFSIY